MTEPPDCAVTVSVYWITGGAWVISLDELLSLEQEKKIIDDNINSNFLILELFKLI